MRHVRQPAPVCGRRGDGAGVRYSVSLSSHPFRRVQEYFHRLLYRRAVSPRAVEEIFAVGNHCQMASECRAPENKRTDRRTGYGKSVSEDQLEHHLLQWLNGQRQISACPDIPGHLPGRVPEAADCGGDQRQHRDSRAVHRGRAAPPGIWRCRLQDLEQICRQLHHFQPAGQEGYRGRFRADGAGNRGQVRGFAEKRG